MRNLSLLALFLSIMVVGGTQAADNHGHGHGVVAVEHARMPLPPSGAPTAAGYMVIHHSAAEPDRILSATSAIARRIEIHETIMENNVMKMRKQDSVRIPGNSSVGFEPGRLHMMFIGLKAPVSVGDQVPVTLTFEHAGDVVVQFLVQERGAAMETMSHGKEHQHPKN